ncbi:MAG: hypothetical protein GXY64_10435 [Bacteroidales bacterium]|nr:hypothetical protein [Bacteroidales bacterium]
MDYKYIEQLLESYFDCRTTLQEEQILRSFFSQEDVPGHLAQYADLFTYEISAKEEQLGEDFDQRIMAKIEVMESEAKKNATPSTRIIKMRARHIGPFFKAAAVVAMALTIGRAAEHAIGEQTTEDNANAVAVDPYIKSGDVHQAIRVKDVSQAETKAINDSILNVATKEEIQ